MILLIDAYNILKQISSSLFVTEQERISFIKKLEQYAQRKNHQIVVVFDGIQPDSSTRSTIVTIIYSGHKSADDIIKKLVTQFEPDNSLLISSDRAVCSFANNYDIACLDSIEFYKILLSYNLQHHNSTKSTCIQKISNDSSQEIDELMHKASTTILYKETDYTQNHSVRGKKQDILSKKEKRLQALLQKL